MIRQQAYWELEHRRPSYQGIGQIDRRATVRMLNRLVEPMARGAFRLMVTNALITRARMQRDPEQGLCDLCEEPETVEHVLWTCPRWEQWRKVTKGRGDQYPAATRLCGILLHEATKEAKQIQEQIYEIHVQYIRWRQQNIPWPPPRPDRRPPEDERESAPVQQRIPVRRIRSKTSPSEVPTLGPRPFEGEWRQHGHVGECRRTAQGWKAHCQVCGATRLWTKRHLMSRCQEVPKGRRVQPAAGFHRIDYADQSWIACVHCGAQSVWAARCRFQRRHHCKLDGEQNVTQRPPSMMRDELEQEAGYHRHTPVHADGFWTCSQCTRRVKRRQSLLQTWCRAPAGASIYMYR